MKLVIYDILGREVKTLVNNEFKTAGKYITEFNGSYLSSGIYFCKMSSGDFTNSIKMLLIK